jgi:hypothetical protein
MSYSSFLKDFALGALNYFLPTKPFFVRFVVLGGVGAVAEIERKLN